jgi:hypothetical protein
MIDTAIAFMWPTRPDAVTLDWLIPFMLTGEEDMDDSYTHPPLCGVRTEQLLVSWRVCGVTSRLTAPQAQLFPKMEVWTKPQVHSSTTCAAGCSFKPAVVQCLK